MYVSIDLVEEIIERQLKKYKTKLTDQAQSAQSFSEAYLEEESEEPEAIVIKRTKRFAVKPMDPEEACIQMELLGHSFFVFRNGDTDEVNVVYKRKDGSYGLIEPISDSRHETEFCSAKVHHRGGAFRRLPRRGAVPSGRCYTRHSSERRMPRFLQGGGKMDDTYNLQSAEESRFLSRRLWILLWLVIISTVTDFFSDTNFMNELPALYWPCLVLNVLCFWAYALVLLDMGSVSGYYKTAGILHLVCGGIGVLIIILSGTRALSLALYLSYSVMVLSVIAAYNEFRGHSEELLYLDPELSAGWMRLWKWFWILMAVIIAAAVLSPLLRSYPASPYWPPEPAL